MPLQNYKRSFAPLELKILFAILSCWAYRQWIIAKGPMVNWPIAFTKCYGAIPVSYGTIGNKSAQKAEYGMRGAIAFDEIGIDSWYVRTSDGSIVYSGYVGYFGIGIVKGNTDH